MFLWNKNMAARNFKKNQASPKKSQPSVCDRTASTLSLNPPQGDVFSRGSLAPLPLPSVPGSPYAHVTVFLKRKRGNNSNS